MTVLNHLGLCKSVNATRAAVDKIRASFDSKLKGWKAEAESHVQKPGNERRLRSCSPSSNHNFKGRHVFILKSASKLSLTCSVLEFLQNNLSHVTQNAEYISICDSPLYIKHQSACLH